MYRNEKNILNKLSENEPWVLLLVGVPLVGKSTFIKNLFPDTRIISRDNALMEFADERGLTYNEAFKEVSAKKVNKRLNAMILESSASNENVIVDMTNLSKKRRRSNLANFGKKYTKFAVIFETPEWEELMLRNKLRNEQEGKWIPINVMKNFIEAYTTPTKDEGFTKIWTI